MLTNIRIVLVNTSHTGNIGSVARAMKTMGLSQLVLVDPVTAPDSHAMALAAGATDILANARTVSCLSDAIEDCGLVIGTSARNRTWSWPMVDARESAIKLLSEGQKYPVALVFGRENSGLSNEELQLCNFHVCLPTNPDYSSLNLAMAVQILSYEIRMKWLEQQAADAPQGSATGEPNATESNAAESNAADPNAADPNSDYPSSAEMQGFYEHLQQTLSQTGFIKDKHPGQVMMKLKRLFNRARPEKQEMNILRGILASVQAMDKKRAK